MPSRTGLHPKGLASSRQFAARATKEEPRRWFRTTDGAGAQSRAYSMVNVVRLETNESPPSDEDWVIVTRDSSGRYASEEPWSHIPRAQRSMCPTQP